MARHTVTLRDGHRVSVAVAGRGVPLVVVHGFTADGFLYVQTLARLVSMGFKVIAIDTAGHGGTQVLPQGGWDLSTYSELLGRAVDALGIRAAVVAGHSMGGRLVADLAAARPERTIGVLLLDAIVGQPWDRLVNVCRAAPPLLGLLGLAMLVDTLGTVPVGRDRSQAAKLARLGLPMMARHLRKPWRVIAPGVSILRSGGTRDMLERLRTADVPVIAIHGERDLIVPLAAARDAAERSGGELVVVKGATHSWPLRDPETLPSIVAGLLEGRLGASCDRALRAGGADPDRATVDDVERALYEPDALAIRLTPELPRVVDLRGDRPAPHYRWSRWSAMGPSPA